MFTQPFLHYSEMHQYSLPVVWASLLFLRGVFLHRQTEMDSKQQECQEGLWGEHSYCKRDSTFLLLDREGYQIHIMLRDCHAYCSAEHRLSSEVVAFLQLPVCKRIAYHCQCQECLMPCQKNLKQVKRRIFGKQTHDKIPKKKPQDTLEPRIRVPVLWKK